MRAGLLRERVVIQRATESTNSQGQMVLTWPGTTVATVHAAVRPVPRQTGESLAAGKVTAQVDYEVEIRYRADVTPKMRLSWTPFRGTARLLEIHEIDLKDREYVV